MFKEKSTIELKVGLQIESERAVTTVVEDDRRKSVANSIEEVCSLQYGKFNYEHGTSILLYASRVVSTTATATSSHVKASELRFARPPDCCNGDYAFD